MEQCSGNKLQSGVHNVLDLCILRHFRGSAFTEDLTGSLCPTATLLAIAIPINPVSLFLSK